jgi:hypothetical protein
MAWNRRQWRPRLKNQVSPDHSSTPSLSVTTNVSPFSVMAAPSGLSVIHPLLSFSAGSRS